MKSPSTLNVHLKPTKRCNLRCRYCFEQNDFVNAPELDLDKLRVIFNKIRSYCLKTGLNSVRLNYTGGEVLVLGVHYWEEAMALQRQILESARIKVQTHFQTNLLLLDDRYIAFFKDHNILVGTSLDPFSTARVFESNKITITSSLIDKLIMLSKNFVPFGLLMMLTRENYLKAGRALDLFNKNKLYFHTQIMMPSSRCFAPDLVLTGQEFGQALVLMLERYISFPADKRIYVSSLESYVQNVKYGRLVSPVSICSFNKYCFGNRLFIESNGDIHPCDTLKLDRFYLGNIFRNSLSEIMGNLSNKFIFRKLKNRYKILQAKCADCEFVKMCNGGCIGHAYWEGKPFDRPGIFCTANKMAYSFLAKNKELIKKHF